MPVPSADPSKLREMIVLRVAAKYHVLYEWRAQSTRRINGCRVRLETTDKIGDESAPVR